MKKKKAPVAGAFTPYFLRNFRIEISGFVSDVQAGGWLGGEKSLPEREALAHLSHLWLRMNDKK